jgi:hypothetical protein
MGADNDEDNYDDDDRLTVVQDASRLLPGPSTYLRTSSLRYVGHENYMSIIFKKTRNNLRHFEWYVLLQPE